MVATVMLVGTLTGCALLAGPPPNPLVGTWNVAIDTPLGVQEMVMTVAEGAEGLTGTIEGGDLFDEPLVMTNIMVVDCAVTFDVSLELGGEQIEATFEGMLEGDNVSGTLKTPLGDAEVTGTRAVADEAA